MVGETSTSSERGAWCPVCGGAVKVERLLIEDDDVAEEVFAFECLRGDFRVSVTRGRLHKIVTEAVKERVQHKLRCGADGLE